jgi:diketogulonate reductase-like aldo/keto reductase
MEDLVDAGKIRFIGVSNFYLEDLKAAQHALTRHKIVANEMPYSLVERTIETCGLIEFCRNQGVSIIAYSPLAGVIKAMRNANVNMNICGIAKAANRSALQVALAWCLRHDHVFAIPKASKFLHIKECVDASGTRLSEAQVDALNKCVKFKIRTALELRLRRWVRGALRAIHEPMK